MIHGFAFVEMDIPLAARRAIIAFNGRMIRGRKVIVQLARGNPRKQNKREETEDLSAAIDELIQTEQRKASSSLSDNSVTLGKVRYSSFVFLRGTTIRRERACTAPFRGLHV